MSENGPQADDNTLLRQIRELLRAESAGGGSGLTNAQLRATPVPVSMSSDIEIGAVELKDGSSDNRASISAAGAVKVDGSAVTQPVSISGNQAVNLAQVAGTTTVNGGTAGTQAVGGVQADDVAASGNNPQLVAGVTADPTSLPADTVAGRLKRFVTNLKGILLSIIPNLDAGFDAVRLYALPANCWSYAAAASGISNTTTAVTVKTAAGVGIRNYVNSLQLVATALGAATEFAIRDGAGGTVLWRGIISTAGMLGGQPMVFNPPLRGSANTLLEVVALTDSLTGSVYPNLQGYSSTV